LAGQTRIMVGLGGNEIKTTPLEEVLNKKVFKLSEDMLEMMEVLSI
jgi:6-phosphofructokinase 1